MTEGPLLQLALDVLELDEGLKAAHAAADSIDVIEAGTLLCLSEGMNAIRTLRGAFPQKTIVGDVRIVRAGKNIADMAFDAGADWVTVVGEAPLETIEAAVKAAGSYGGEIQVELNHDWTEDQAREWRGLSIRQVIFHSTAEVGAMGEGWSQLALETVQQLSSLGFQVTATGGIQVETIPSFSGIPVFAFIAGRSIVKADEPADAARRFKKAIRQLP
ncbi:MAG: orotidine 5'-phosphate decarboxylase [Rhodospirillales bacterium]|nr:orotidine 5'-phosphate decarboxylase [Rhodospirillales bacterium]